MLLLEKASVAILIIRAKTIRGMTLIFSNNTCHGADDVSFLLCPIEYPASRLRKSNQHSQEYP